MATPTQKVHIRGNVEYPKNIFEPLYMITVSPEIFVQSITSVWVSLLIKICIFSKLINEEGKRNHTTGKSQHIQHTKLKIGGGKYN